MHSKWQCILVDYVHNPCKHAGIQIFQLMQTCSTLLIPQHACPDRVCNTYRVHRHTRPTTWPQLYIIKCYPGTWIKIQSCNLLFGTAAWLLFGFLLWLDSTCHGVILVWRREVYTHDLEAGWAAWRCMYHCAVRKMWYSRKKVLEEVLCKHMHSTWNNTVKQWRETDVSATYSYPHAFLPMSVPYHNLAMDLLHVHIQ